MQLICKFWDKYILLSEANSLVLDFKARAADKPQSNQHSRVKSVG